MTLVFFFVGILVILMIFLIGILLSSIRIKIENIRINNLQLNQDYKVYIQLYFFNKIKFFSKRININNDKVKNKNSRKKIKNLINKINSSKMNLKIDLGTIKELYNLKIKLEKLRLYIEIGYEDASKLSVIVGLLNSIVSIILPGLKARKEDIKYFIKPNYSNNTLNISFDSIISIKVVHIIYMICKIIKKGRMKDERTSNRRINAVQL